jgi:hypothetical protein
VASKILAAVTKKFEFGIFGLSLDHMSSIGRLLVGGLNLYMSMDSQTKTLQKTKTIGNTVTNTHFESAFRGEAAFPTKKKLHSDRKRERESVHILIVFPKEGINRSESARPDPRRKKKSGERTRDQQPAPHLSWQRLSVVAAPSPAPG